MRKTLFLVVTALVVFSMVLSACGEKPAATTTAPTPGQTTGPAPTTTAPRPTATVATTTPAGGQPVYGGILKVSSSASPSTLIPETQLIRQWFHQANYDALLRLDENGQLQPNLATEWTRSADNKTLTMTLRKGVKFHDGTDLNAEAAKWAILKKKAAKLGEYEEVTSVDVLDEFTFRLNLSKFNNTLMGALWFLGGMMYSPTTYEKWGKDEAKWHPVGTGPFKFVRYDINQLIKYERFDGYWRKDRPYLDGYEQLPIADATTRELALRRGEIDAAEALTPKVINALGKEGWTVMKGPVEVYNNFAMDTVNPDSPYYDKRVRQAVEYAIDREAVVKALGFDNMEVMYQNAPSNSYAYDPNFVGRKYDPAKAKQLLTEAGFPNGFKTTILTVFSISDNLAAAQGYLKEVGIEGTIDVADIGRYYNIARSAGYKNTIIFRARRQVPDYLWDQYKELSTTSIDLKSTLRPPGLQEALEAAIAAPDDASRAAAAKKFVKLQHDESVIIPLWGSNYTIVRGKGINNLEFYVPWGKNKLWSPADTWKSK